MDVYLKNEKEKETFHFPVNPIDSITVNRSKKYDTADIIDIGEVDIPDKGKKIKELSFNTLLPKGYDTYCRYRNIPKPTDTMTKLERWMEQQEPLRLIITDFNFNSLVIISNIDEETRAGETGDKYINISFRTWRDMKIQALPPPKKSSSSTSTKKLPLRNNRTTTTSRHRAGEWIVVTASVLNVRERPGTDRRIIGQIRRGRSYKIGRVQGNWADIYWGKHGGWICLDYVR